ncbi:MAG: hypothetical protein KAJ03_05100 [Gammaproteobacteria bacterium]|nr:hypothetical protein [Gammaproteobacteria bacterium]
MPKKDIIGLDIIGLFCLLCLSIVVLIGGMLAIVGYTAHNADDNMIQTENEISRIINNAPNMTPIQKVTLISSMCDNGAQIRGMGNECKEKLYLKHIE